MSVLNCTLPPEIGPSSTIAVEESGMLLIGGVGVIGFVGTTGTVWVPPVVLVLPDHHHPQAVSESMSATCVDFWPKKYLPREEIGKIGLFWGVPVGEKEDLLDIGE